MAFRIAEDVTVLGLRVRVRAPIDPAHARGFTGSVRLNGSEPVPVVKAPTDPDATEIVFPPETLSFDGVNTLLVVNDATIRPVDIDPAIPDERELGIGLVSLGLVTPAVDALRLPSPAAAAGHERYRALIGREHAAGTEAPVATPGTQAVDDTAGRQFTAGGWYGLEPWGRWAAQPRATLHFHVPALAPLSAIDLSLRSPPTPADQPVTGRVRLNDGEWMPFAAAPETGDAIGLRIAGDRLVLDGTNWIEIESDRLVRATDYDAASPDQRALGFGIRSLTFHA